MKASEQFKSMEEVRQLAEQLRASVGEENFEYIEYALGILENQGIWQEVELNGEIIKLDRSMVDFIKDLNSRGYTTLACCSGLLSEHPNEKFKPTGGYIAFVFDAVLLADLQAYFAEKVASGLMVIEESECYLKPCVSIHIKSNNEEALKQEWSNIWTYFKGRK